jgi:hypothetical protein
MGWTCRSDREINVYNIPVGKPLRKQLGEGILEK